MKIIKYEYKGNSVMMEWNEINEDVAKREADGGEYTVAEADEISLE